MVLVYIICDVVIFLLFYESAGDGCVPDPCIFSEVSQ